MKKFNLLIKLNVFGGMKLKYKMIIVDDEPFIRAGLKKYLEWDKIGIEIVGEAESGLSALDVARKTKPDIIMTDIRMPDMDGLKMICILNKEFPDSLFIIHSGYDEFEYAKEALKLRVFNYLLKPLQYEETLEVFKECIKQLKQNKEKKEKEKVLENQLKESEQIIQERAMTNILINNTGTVNKEKLKKQKIDLLNDMYSVMVIRYYKVDEIFISIDDFLTKVKIILHNIVHYNYENDLKHYVFVSRQKIYCIISVSQEKNIKLVLNDIIKKVMNKLEVVERNKLLFGISPCIKNIGMIGQGIKKAEDVLRYNIINNDKQILYYDEQYVKMNNPLFLSEKDKKLLIKCIESNNKGDFNYLTEQLSKYATYSANLSPEQLYSFLQEIINISIRYLYKNGMNLESKYSNEIFSIELLNGFNNVNELFEWMYQFIRNLIQDYNEIIDNKPKRIFAEIENYIIENIDKEITLNTISEKFYYNSAYLSRLFKEELHKNYTTYITEIRIEHAKDLLLHNTKVKDIPEMIGYKSYKYFVNIFKKMTGVTPIEYRKYGGE